jgi:cytidine deaminase
VIYEFGPDAIIIYRKKDGSMGEANASELLPEGFRLR